jgi:FkbM family methyltransferase
MSDINVVDVFGQFSRPDNIDALGVYQEVCVQDTYGFRALHAAGFKVRTAVDLGASWGMAARMIRHFWPAARIVAFEPDPLRFAYLARNCPSVECRNYAVAGFATDRAKMLAGIGLDNGPWRQNVDQAFSASASGVPSYMTDPPASVASAFSGISDIDLLKIDVEGFELGIIREMKELGLLANVRGIVGEWHFENARLGLAEDLAATHDATFTMPVENAGPWQAFVAVLRKTEVLNA